MAVSNPFFCLVNAAVSAQTSSQSVADRVNRLNPHSRERRDDAAQGPDARGDGDARNGCSSWEGRGVAEGDVERLQRQESDDDDRDTHSDDAGDKGRDDRLHEDRKEDACGRGADGSADADLAHALAHGHNRNVQQAQGTQEHDDAADDHDDVGDGAELFLADILMLTAGDGDLPPLAEDRGQCTRQVLTGLVSVLGAHLRDHGRGAHLWEGDARRIVVCEDGRHVVGALRLGDADDAHRGAVARV